MDRWVGGWVDAWIDQWMNGWMSEWLGVAGYQHYEALEYDLSGKK
jgi:hypothetical protein